MQRPILSDVDVAVSSRLAQRSFVSPSAVAGSGRRPSWQRASTWCLLVVVCLSAAACNQKKQKQEAYDQWNAARANVQGNLATEQFKNGNLPDARKSVDEAMKLDPRKPVYHLLSARIYIETAALEAAQRELDIVRELDPRNAEADYLSGIVYQRWQKPNLALDYYTKATEKSPADLAYLLARAEMLINVGQLSQATSLLESKLAYFEHSAPLRDMLGELYLQQNRAQDAATILHQATILLPDNLEITEHYVRALFRTQQYRDCVTQLAKLTKDPTFAKRADLHLLLGECYLQLDRVRDAKAEFETVANTSPNLTAGWLGLAKAAMALGDNERCDIALKKAQSLEPDSAQVYLAVGYLRMRQNRNDEAMAALLRASELDPKDPLALCLIGLMHERSGKKDLAAEYYGKALQAKPDDQLARDLMTHAK